MTVSPIFSGAPRTLRQRVSSPIFSGEPRTLRQRVSSPIFSSTLSYILPTLVPSAFDLAAGALKQVSPQDTLTSTTGVPAIEGTKRLLATITGIDATATGTTLLYTVPAGVRVMVTEAIIRVDSATSVTIPITAGIGVAAGEDDIAPSTQLVNLLVADQSYAFDITGLARIANAADVINFGIDTAITGTAQSLSVYLFGIQASV